MLKIPCNVTDQIHLLSQCRFLPPSPPLFSSSSSSFPRRFPRPPVLSAIVSDRGEASLHTGSGTLADRLRLGALVEDGLSYKEKFIVRCYEVGINKTATVETIANLLQVISLTSFLFRCIICISFVRFSFVVLHVTEPSVTSFFISFNWFFRYFRGIGSAIFVCFPILHVQLFRFFDIWFSVAFFVCFIFLFFRLFMDARVPFFLQLKLTKFFYLFLLYDYGHLLLN